jgi:hypothetical protein
MIVRMMNEIKEDINKHLNELKENTNKQLNKIRKTMQNIKGIAEQDLPGTEGREKGEGGRVEK